MAAPFNPPASLPLSALNAEHAHYTLCQESWQTYEDFYAGGEQLRRNAQKYLTKRQKEPVEVYAERLRRVFYENYLGAILDWYAATLFGTAPQVDIEEKRSLDRTFYDAFLADCDRNGTTFADFLKAVYLSALIRKTAWVLIDFPNLNAPAANQAEEDRLGKSRAYLVSYNAPDILDWGEDAAGNLEYVKVKTCNCYRPDPFTAGQRLRDTWTIYTRENFARYERDRELQVAKEASSEKDTQVALAEYGRHALSSLKRVPFIRLTLGQGLWLADRCGTVAREHFEKSNALSWALHMGLFAMPVVYSEREWHQIMGESYYIQLGPEDRFGWTEPEGKVYQLAADNLDRLKDEIYRLCYLMSQAGGREAKNIGQSGVSKAFDYQVVHEILEAYGQTIKAAGTRILSTVAEARSEDARAISVRGLDNFDIRALEDDIANALELRSLVRASETFQRELTKRIAMKALDDAPEKVKKQIAQEIDVAPVTTELPEPGTPANRPRPGAQPQAEEQE